MCPICCHKSKYESKYLNLKNQVHQNCCGEIVTNYDVLKQCPSEVNAPENIKEELNSLRSILNVVRGLIFILIN